jgi:hypothetical protein
MPDPAPETAPVEQVAAPAPAVAVAERAAEPEYDAGGAGRELAPGKTVTIIPASSGPSSAPVEPEGWPGAEGSRGGVRGISIAGRIPVGVPGRRLR